MSHVSATRSRLRTLTSVRPSRQHSTRAKREGHHLIRRQRLALLGGAITLALAAATTSAQAATAASPSTAGPAIPAAHRSASFGATPSEAAVMARQPALDAARDAITKAAAQQPDSGFAGTWVDAVHDDLTLYWHGALTGAPAVAVRELRAKGVDVIVASAAYTAQQMNAAVNVLRSSAAARAAGATRFEPLYDGGGVQVGIPTAAGVRTEVIAPSVAASLQNVAGGVKVRVVSVLRSKDYTREADSGAMRGGAVLTSPTSNGYETVCSSGFALTWPAIGKQYLVTAGHCGSTGSSWGNGQNIFIGEAQGASSTANDALFINVSSSSPYIYDGPGADISGQFTKPVVGVTSNGPGDYVCDSGAITGAVCDLQIQGSQGWDGPYHVWTATQLQGDIAAGQGDSGGPVFSLATNENQVIARGIIHGGAGNLVCSSPYEGSYPCSTDVEFTDINAIVASFSGLQVSLY
jgi:hypothetical protein